MDVVAVGPAVAAAVWGADAAFCRMSGLKPFVALSWKPTAATVPSLRAVTAERPLAKSPGFGLLIMLQLVPFHCSTRVVEAPVVEVPAPTAKMSLAEIAAIPFREVSEVVGLATRLQLVPFQCSMDALK